jgi:hypothetical protein
MIPGVFIALLLAKHVTDAGFFLFGSYSAGLPSLHTDFPVRIFRSRGGRRKEPIKQKNIWFFLVTIHCHRMPKKSVFPDFFGVSV